MNKVDLKFSDFLSEFDDFGKNEWVTVYENHKDDEEETSYLYCALISNSKVKQSLADYSWDLLIGRGFPGIDSYYNGGKKTMKYSRYSNNKSEPLILWRNFNNLKEGYWEVSEEFRHYFNLYEDRNKNKFILINENGDDEDVISISDKEIKIKIRLIKEFISVKKMCLALFFDFNRFSRKTLKENGLKGFEQCKKGENFIYFMGFKRWPLENEIRKSQSFLTGKKIIFGIKNFNPDKKDKNKKFEKFIIGVDENGEEIVHTCEKNKLANYFGLNKGSPHYLTPVVFKREVLIKYYNQPNKYSVGDGHLYCGGLWELKLDNNHSDFVMVCLGDLGHLSYSEQLYWKSYNIVATGGISDTAWSRGFEAKFTNPERIDLYFKQSFYSFQKKWVQRFKWELFIPLHKEDEHHFKSLRIPLTNEISEFDTQIASLVKIFIDSLNEKQIEKGLNIIKEEPKGMDKLEKFLLARGLNFPDMMSFLRNLYDLRSTGIAHRKGKRYDKVKKYFLIGEKDLSVIFEDILVKCIWVLNTFESHLLKVDV
ncbi:hypothetical protein D4R87_03305 [bacterium]|nr:MAG: hypothetical protein D4R87_03305 [bacterium]